jgi:hypothetical protein
LKLNRMFSWQSKSEINIPITTDIKDSISFTITCEVLCIHKRKSKRERKFETLTK